MSSGRTAFVVIEEEYKGSIGLFDQRIICMWDSRRKAEQYIAKREENDARRGEKRMYAVVPWVVQS